MGLVSSVAAVSNPTGKTTLAKTASITGAISADFRKGQAGKNFIKMLFDPNSSIPNPVQVTQLLQQLGVKVPTGVRIGADVAQMVMSGGAIVNDINQGASIGAFINPASTAIKAGVDLLELAGLMDKNSPAARLVQFGTDAALVIATGGLNVLADISLVLDIVKEAMSFSPPDLTPMLQAQATAYATASQNNYIANREKGQINSAAARFLAYHDKTIDVFELMGDVALESPDLFGNYFPDLKMFVPPSLITFTTTATVSKSQPTGLFGLGSGRDYVITESVSKSLETIVTSKSKLQEAFVQKYLAPLFQTYMSLQDWERRWHVNQAGEKQSAFYPFAWPKKQRPDIVKHDRCVARANIATLAALSMFPPYFDFLDDTFDVKPFLLSAGLTPSDFGDGVLLDEMSAGDYSPTLPLVKPALKAASLTLKQSPLNINGVDIQSGTSQLYNENLIKLQNQMVTAQLQANTEYKTLLAADKSGDIRTILQNRRGSRIISEWGFLPYSPVYQYDPNLNYRRMREFWGHLSVLNTFQKSPFYQDYQGGVKADKWAQSLGLDISTSGDFNDYFRDLQFKSMARKMNNAARLNVAQAFGIPVEKLKFLPTNKGQLAKIA